MSAGFCRRNSPRQDDNMDVQERCPAEAAQQHRATPVPLRNRIYVLPGPQLNAGHAGGADDETEQQPRAGFSTFFSETKQCPCWPANPAQCLRPQPPSPYACPCPCSSSPTCSTFWQMLASHGGERTKPARVGKQGFHSWNGGWRCAQTAV